MMTMNVKKNILLILVGLGGLYACQKGDSFLDKKSTAELDEAAVFVDSARTLDFLNGLYSNASFNMIFGANNLTTDMSRMSDEAEGRYPAAGNFDKQVTQGNFGGSFYSVVDEHWSLLYANIRHANIYLKNVDSSPLAESTKQRTRAEARLLRVWYYHFLLKYFGGVPLVGDQIFTIDDTPSIKRSTYADCVQYLLDELDQITPQLPLSYQGLNYGRVTRGAALALKSRILLYAASPLFNGGSLAEPGSELEGLVSYPSFDQNRWEQARLAAKAVIDMNRYSLQTDNETRPGNGFYSVFLTRVNNEFIFERPQPPGKQVEIAFVPRSRGGSWYYHYPTQELVDMFPMINGLPISDPASGYEESDPYKNRDPRFGYTVIYNGSLFFLNSARDLAPVYTYSGAAQDGIVAVTVNSATITGYYHRKFCDEYAAPTGGGNTEGSQPLIRYAEILLNYAEAANEMGQTADAMETIRQLRVRAGIEPGANGWYGLPENPSQEEARRLIWNERAIELAFEQHRYWDVRRWKRGEEFDGEYVHGMQITQNGDGWNYERIPVRTRYFKDNSYLFPIPQGEIALNREILQNPGW